MTSPLADELNAIASWGEPRKPRVLTVDIETSPNLCYTWGLWNQNVSLTQLLEPSRVLSFAAKWLGERKVHYWSEHHNGRGDMIRASWELYNEADMVVTYNGVSFDNAHLRREWLLAGLGPARPWQDVDLMLAIKKNFRFQSNKLAHVTEQVGLPAKIETGGQSLWNAVMDGDPGAWAKFRRYNINDVLITESLFLFLRDWLNLPHAGLWTGDMAACHQCGSRDLRFAGLQRYKVMAYASAVCGGCGAVNRILRNGQTRKV